MDNAHLYEHSNGVQKRDAVEYLDKYVPKMKWKKKNNRIMDVGSGDGTVTTMLTKYFPNEYKLSGIDISENMVKYANDHHCNENISFTVLDIAGDLPDSLEERFDHVFSFYTLHWVKNQEKAFKNIFNLLEKGGECFMIFLASNLIYEAFRALSRQSKWSILLADIENKFIGPYHDSQEPDEEVINLMENIGFINIQVECKDLSYPFDNMNNLKDHLKSINPFKIPSEKHDNFYEECIQVLKDKQINTSDNCIHIYYKLLVVYGQK